MSDEPRKRPPRGSRALLIFCGFLLAVLVEVMTGLVTFIAVPLFYLAVGWVSGVVAVSGRMFDAGWSIGIWVCGFVATTVVLHLLLRGIFRQNCPGFRTTASVSVLVIAALAAGMALGGLVHQVGWLIGTKEKLYRSSFDGHVRNSQLKREFESAHGLAAHSVTHSEWREQWAETVSANVRGWVFGDPAKPVEAMLVRPESNEVFQTSGGAVFERVGINTYWRTVSAPEFAEAMLRFHAKEAGAE